MVPVRNGTEYGYGKKIAGLSTGTDYFQKTKYVKIRVRTVFGIQGPETVWIRIFFLRRGTGTGTGASKILF